MIKTRSGLNSWVRVPERSEGGNNNNNEGNGRDNDYHEFEGVSDYDGWEYEGDDVQQVLNFFRQNSNSYELLDSLTNEERGAFQEWTRGALMDSEQWYDWHSISRWTQNIIRNIAKKLDTARLDRGMVVTRLGSGELLPGIGRMASSLGELQALKGQVIPVNGLMSWGAAKEGLLIPGGGRPKNIEFKLRIPAGTRGAGTWIGDSRVSPYWGARQREFITNRDIDVRVGDSRYDRRRDKYVVELEYVGRRRHPF